jgi:hypothetical protein
MPRGDNGDSLDLFAEASEPVRRLGDGELR